MWRVDDAISKYHGAQQPMNRRLAWSRANSWTLSMALGVLAPLGGACGNSHGDTGTYTLTGGSAAFGGTASGGVVSMLGGAGHATGGNAGSGGFSLQTGGSTGAGGAATNSGGAGGTAPGAGGTAGSGGLLASGGDAPASGGQSGGSSGATSGGSVGQGGSTAGGGSGGSSGYNPCPTSGDPCRILPLGDSITNGVASTDLGGYRSRLYALILAANQKVTFTGSQSSGPDQVSGAPFPKSHEGRSGWTIEPGYSTWAGGISNLVPTPAFDTVPNIVLLMIGTNDVTAASGQSTMADRLEALLDKIVLAAPDALIVVAQLTPLSWNPSALSDYNAQIPRIVAARAAAGHHIVSVDMSQMPLSGLDDDHVHPNDQGYSFMADIWYAAIDGVLPR